MAKRAPQMTSSEAIGSFKAKITESLPLLGFLNNEDKCDVWRFWKTVSSAVKIAVNGKGDIVETQRRHYKSARYIRDRQLEGNGLHHIDRSAITIYVPVRCSNGFRKFRVLKIANHKKISDYYEAFPVLEGDVSESPLPDADLENIDISSLIIDLDASKVEKNSCDKATTNSIATDEELSAVVNFLKGIQTKNSVQESKGSLQQADIERDSRKSEMVKPVRKIWPVGRPTTRSLGVRVIRDKCCESDDTNRNVKKSKCENDNVSSITFYPSVKEEMRESVEEDFDITIVPVGSGVMQISKRKLSGLKDHIHDSQEVLNQQLAASHLASSTLNSEESIFHQSMHSESPLEDYQMHVVLPEISNAESQIAESDRLCLASQGEINPNMDGLHSDPVYDPSVSESKHDQNVQSNITPRNASDIETIISALEAELKKAVTSVKSEPYMNNKTTEEVMVSDVQADFEETPVQTVQILDREEIVDVQQMGNVIWTSEGEVQLLGSAHVVDSAASSEVAVVFEGQPVEPQYDVVEYEVLADKKLKRGRKKKVKEENSEEKSELVDRTCPICHTVLNYASSMTAHMRIHTGVRPYSCGQCDRSFTTKANRDRHEATHVGLKPFQCNQCNKSFTEKRSLKIHMRSHTGERPFVCNVCGRGFAQKCTLLIHMDRHTNKKGHLCDLCGKAFRQKSQLDVHVKRHKRQASYPCNECSTKCYTRGDLMRHMIKHTGDRPYRCELCNRAFTRKQYLIDHENQHYGRKPYRCSVCSATFHDMGSCHRHLRKHKQDEEGENSKGSTKSALLSSTDFHMILEGTQIGQVLKLYDGTEALVKAVTAEADGSTVYHMTCIGKLPSTTVTNATEPLEDAAQEDRGTEASS